MEETPNAGATVKDSPESEALNELIAGVGAVTDKGVRSENQDRMSRAEVPLGELLIVADGVGGNVGGATAATLTIETIEENLGSAAADQDPQAALRAAIEKANQVVYEPSHSGDPAFHNMASTVVAILVRKGTAYLAHVGDSRAYLLREGKLSRLTKDHTRIQQMLDAGQLTPEQAAQHPDSGTITRAIGDKPEVQVEVGEPFPLLNGDGLLLCSDGLHGSVDDTDVLATIQSAKYPQQAAEELLSLASKRGSRDNITVQYALFQLPRKLSAVPSGKETGRKEQENGDKKRTTVWPVAVAAMLAAAAGVGGYVAYPLINTPGGSGGTGPIAGLAKEYDAAVAQVTQLDAVYRVKANAEQKAAQDLKQVEASAATEQQGQAKATEALARATQSVTEATAALAQAQRDATEKVQAREALKPQVDAVMKELSDLNAKETKTDEETQKLTELNARKQGLDQNVNSAQQAAEQAARQATARLTELNQAKQRVPQAASAAQAQGSSADTTRRLEEAKHLQAQAAAALQTASGSLSDAKRNRDEISEALKRIGVVVSAPPDSGAAVPPPHASNKPASVKVVILAAKADDKLAAALRDYFQAHPVDGVSVEIAQSSKIDTAGPQSASATLYYSSASPQTDRAPTFKDVSEKATAAVRAFMTQSKNPAPKISVVITSTGN